MTTCTFAHIEQASVDLMFLLRFFHSFVAVDQFSIIYVTVVAVGVELVRSRHSRYREKLSE